MITSTPKFERTIRSERWIRNLQILLIACWCVPAIGVFAWSYIAYTHDVARGIELPSVLGAVVATALLAVIVTVLALCSLFGFDDEEFSGRGVFWLPNYKCSELLDLCNNNPDLNDFRDRVVAEGRRFTCGEYVAMKQWPERKARLIESAKSSEMRRHTCSELYGADHLGISGSCSYKEVGRKPDPRGGESITFARVE